MFRRKASGGFESAPEAYLNLTRLVADYPLIGCAGAMEALSMMAADWSANANVKTAKAGS